MISHLTGSVWKSSTAQYSTVQYIRLALRGEDQPTNCPHSAESHNYDSAACLVRTKQSLASIWLFYQYISPAAVNHSGMYQPTWELKQKTRRRTRTISFHFCFPPLWPEAVAEKMRYEQKTLRQRPTEQNEIQPWLVETFTARAALPPKTMLACPRGSS